MAKPRSNELGRARMIVAQEAARIIVDHGIRDYRLAKQKAAERLGVVGRGSLPGNAEIEAAVVEHLQIFGGDSHADQLRLMRVAALSAMDLLAQFSPRLVGPVLTGTADENSAVNLHVFADSAEIVAMELADIGINYRLIFHINTFKFKTMILRSRQKIHCNIYIGVQSFALNRK